VCDITLVKDNLIASAVTITKAAVIFFNTEELVPIIRTPYRTVPYTWGRVESVVGGILVAPDDRVQGTLTVDKLICYKMFHDQEKKCGTGELHVLMVCI